jgi:uncharacterized membrane protein
MAHIERQIIIDDSPEKVFRLLLDASRAPEWRVGLEQVSQEHGDERGVAFSWVSRMMGRRLVGRTVYYDMRDGELIRERSEGMIDMHWEWRLASLPGPRTALQVVIDYTLPDTVLGRIADKLIVERQNEHDVAQTLENLKALAEDGVLRPHPLTLKAALEAH